MSFLSLSFGYLAGFGMKAKRKPKAVHYFLCISKFELSNTFRLNMLYVCYGEKEWQVNPKPLILQKKEINLVQPLDVCQSYV